MCADAQAKSVQAQKERMQTQEAEISALRRQLESMQVASSRARAGGAGRRQYDGSVPAEYICPITQVRIAQRPTNTKHSAALSGHFFVTATWNQRGHWNALSTPGSIGCPGGLVRMSDL